MNRAQLVFTLVLLAAVLPWLASCGGDSEQALQYHCPMHPTYVKDGAGSCPICGMDLVPVPAPMPGPAPGVAPDTASGPAPNAAAHSGPTPESAVRGYSALHLTAEGVQLAGLRLAPAIRGRLAPKLRAAGTVAADETRIHEVHTRVSGWVESLAVDFTGQSVRKGDPLLTLYAPELVASQEEYLRAREAAARFAASRLPEVREGAEELAASARERLLAFDVPPRLLDRLDAGGAPQRLVSLDAPATGFVTAKEVFAGSRVEPGMALFTITDLSRVWIDAVLYEQEASLLRVGLPAEVTLPYDPAFRASGRVSFIEPTLDPATRRIRVRVELANPDFTLKPGMYADVSLALESAEGLLIPEDAVLDSGARQLVFVRRADGVFEPREVTVGPRTEGRALILSGLAEGEQVVIRANFLLDSESRLRSAIGAAGDGHEHGGGR